MHALRLYGTTGKFTWRMLATVLGGQAVCILLGALVARGVTAVGDDPGRSTAYLVVGFGLAALAVVAAGAMRRPWGLTLGWLVQALTLLSAVVVPMMLVVGLFFLALWITCLVKGAQIDAEVARRDAVAREQGGEPTAGVGEHGTGADGPADRVGE
jgi:hypothetical protein